MRRIIFISVLFISLILAAGCISQNAGPSLATSPPRDASPGSFVPPSGSSIAIAFRTDELSTTSPEAKDQFIKGLTYSTQYARYNDSLAFFDAALAIDQNFSQAWIAKGVALHNMKRYDEAIKNYDSALEINPDDAGAWSLKAMTFRDWGKTTEAGESSRRAAELDPRYRNPPQTPVTPV